MEELRLVVEQGALKTVPCYETHKRGKNWAATVTKDPRSPGGLARTFWPRARGEWYYMVPADLQTGDVVEFGADYYKCSGRPSRTRVYGVVVAEGTESIDFLTGTKAECFKASVGITEQDSSTGALRQQAQELRDKAAAIIAEADDIDARAAELEAEADSVTVARIGRSLGVEEVTSG